MQSVGGFCRPLVPKRLKFTKLPPQMCDLLMPGSVCERLPIHATRAFFRAPPPLSLASGSQNGGKIAGALFANRFFVSFCAFLSLSGVEKRPRKGQGKNIPKCRKNAG